MPALSGPPVYEERRWVIDLGRRELRADGAQVPIGHRAFEIIEVLLQSTGALVSKDDLMRRVWRSAIVEENTLQVHISAIRKALGSDRGMLKTASGRGYRLLGDWIVRGETAPASAVDAAPPSAPTALGNLPLAGSDLIGRAQAIRDVGDLLSAYRAVTLTGPGGIGKSRLALEVARAQVPDFQGDVWLVELAALSNPDLVPSAVAGALGLRLGGEEVSPQSVARAIGGRKALLILDNCEHVIDAAALLAEAVLQTCPHASVLATSQELLRIAGEHAYRVSPLDVPALVEGTPDGVRGYSAVRLFVTRMDALRSGFSPRDVDLPVIAAICRRLDGIPLAIEFAASRAAMLGLDQVSSRLDDRFEVLTSGRRTALPRHRTLRATLDWSYDLLPHDERLTLQRLGVFSGSFPLEAARVVTGHADGGHDNLPPATFASHMTSLVARSLVTADVSGTPTQYRLLETTRAYALEKLTGGGEAQRYFRRHADYYQALFEQAEHAWDTLTPREVRQTLGRHMDNVRAALEWAFGPGRQPEIGIALTIAAAPLWIALFLLEECRALVERALAALAGTPSGHARQEMQLFAMLGVLTQHIDGVGPKLDYPWGKVLALAQSLGDLDYELRALRGLTNGAMTQNHRDALDFARRYRLAAEASPDPSKALIGDRIIGFILHHLGDQAEARRLTEGMLARYVLPPDRRRLVEGTPDPHAIARVVLARILWLQGFPDQAMRLANEAAEQARALDHPVSLFSVIAYAACPIALLEGDLGLAAPSYDMLHAVVETHRPFGPWRDGIAALDLMRRGDPAAGLVMLGEATRAMRDNTFAAHFAMFMAGRIEGLARCGRFAEALEAADAASAHCRVLDEYWYLPEFLRLRGEALLASMRMAEAERDFLAGLKLARTQTALAWELRIAISLARLRVLQDRGEEVRRILGPVFDRFTEGFETADLRAAAAVLVGAV